MSDITEQAIQALTWYMDEAEAIAKHLIAKETTPLTASMQVLGLDAGKRARGAIAALNGEKRAPVQGYPFGIPWAIHLEAYAAYCKRWGPQPALIDLEGRNCRGGFGMGELDEFVPGWRERVSEFTRLREELARYKASHDAPRGTDAQILKERELTASAIRGAMSFGAAHRPPPEPDHWLHEWWQLGSDLEAAQRIADHEAFVILRSNSRASEPGTFLAPAPSHEARAGFDEAAAYLASRGYVARGGDRVQVLRELGADHGL